MNKEDIIRMAREAGFAVDDCGVVYTPDAYGPGDVTQLVKRFAALVAEQERQECARVVISFKNWSRVELLPISEAIKSRRIDINRSSNE